MAWLCGGCVPLKGANCYHRCRHRQATAAATAVCPRYRLIHSPDLQRSILACNHAYNMHAMNACTCSTAMNAVSVLMYEAAPGTERRNRVPRRLCTGARAP